MFADVVGNTAVDDDDEDGGLGSVRLVVDDADDRVGAGKELALVRRGAGTATDNTPGVGLSGSNVGAFCGLPLSCLRWS